MKKTNESKTTAGNLKSWLKKILGSAEVLELPKAAPPNEVVDRLIEKAATGDISLTDEDLNAFSKEPTDGISEENLGALDEESSEGIAPEKNADDSGTVSRNEGEAAGEGNSSEVSENKNSSCPYLLKRNLVASLQEIRRFAEEHNLGAAMVKALLAMLVEMALNALKGKVSGTVLAVLLNAMNFDKARSEAYREGEIAGRNAQIMEKHFPSTDDGLPHLPSKVSKDSAREDIFSIARNA